MNWTSHDLTVELDRKARAKSHAVMCRQLMREQVYFNKLCLGVYIYIYML